MGGGEQALHFGTPVIATDNGMRPEGVHLITAGALGMLEEAILDELAKGRRSGSAGEERNENLRLVREVYRELLA